MEKQEKEQKLDEKERKSSKMRNNSLLQKIMQNDVPLSETARNIKLPIKLESTQSIYGQMEDSDLLK